MSKKEIMASSKNSYWADNASQYDKQTSNDIDILLNKIKTDVGNVSRILDIGAGTGKVSFSLASHTQHIDALDAELKMIEVAKEKAKTKKIKNISFHTASAYQLPFSDNLFDAAVILNALHVMETPENAIHEAKRVIKADGLLIAPTFCHAETEESLNNYQTWSAKSKHKSFHLFTFETLCDLIKSCGFVLRTKEMIKMDFGKMGATYMGYIVGSKIVN